MELQLFYCSDMSIVFYDRDADGRIREFSLRAKRGENNGLYVDTDMDISGIRLITEEMFDGIYVNGVLLQYTGHEKDI